jgi:hypothetical protein
MSYTHSTAKRCRRFSCVQNTPRIFLKCPTARWESQSTARAPSLPAEAVQLYVISTAVYTAVPWYGCPYLPRKHDPLEFFLRKYCGTIHKNGAHMIYFQYTHYIFSTKKNLGHFPRSTIYKQSNNLRIAYYEPPWYAHSTALPQSYPTSLLHLSDVLNLVQGSKTRLGGFCFCVASRLHYKNTSRMGFGFVVPEIYKLSPWSVSSGGLFRKII